MSMDEVEIADSPPANVSAALLDTRSSDEIMKDLTATVNSMSVQEREAGLYDLHGIGSIDQKSVIEEQLLVDKVGLLVVSKRRISSRAATAFRIAHAASPAYTRNAQFLLMFLRCENYNIDASVRRLFTFFTCKLRLFGPDRIGRKMITLSDLSASDMMSYSAGFFQLLPNRDHAGRAQFVILPQFYTWYQHENKVSWHEVTAHGLRCLDISPRGVEEWF